MTNYNPAAGSEAYSGNLFHWRECIVSMQASNFHGTQIMAFAFSFLLCPTSLVNRSKETVDPKLKNKMKPDDWPVVLNRSRIDEKSPSIRDSRHLPLGFGDHSDNLVELTVMRNL